jgi:hypothetical protein
MGKNQTKRPNPIENRALDAQIKIRCILTQSKKTAKKLKKPVIDGLF